ncbi:MAG: Pyruvate kinase [Spirochaetes bacterium ADurb.Bin218]|jgi:pyruvate kinase|nr:pyruvate kinase [Spirochaetota bacterium]OQA96369.1 MAG: Pyruvate kinase [Spirochaetes bacterium ADurb.Bin218]HPX91365.1 pyruvate kinase [Spirochaetota bacterium]
MRKTKIICTLGPATDDTDVLRRIFLTGMDVARLNFSHGTHEEHLKRVEIFKQIRDELKKPVALLLDTKGPEIRLRTFKNGEVILKEGDKFTLTTEEIEGDETRVSISYKGLVNDVNRGDRILIADGLIELRVLEVTSIDIVCEVVNGGELSNRKGVNVPGVTVRLPFLSDNDKKDLIFGIKNDFDYVALSFVRSAEDVKVVQKFMEENGGLNIKLISKIENRDGVRNIDEIIRVSDGVMVARGDMGVEIPFEEIPHLQKMIIKKTVSAGKPVITATQMLDSMIRNPRPTRAEITDVANAIYDGTSALMLSGETSIGKYAELTVATMAKIAEKTETEIDYVKLFDNTHINISRNVTDAISYSTCSAAHSLNAAAIITITKSGHTSRMVSRYRPKCPIIASTPLRKVYNQLALSWGVIPMLAEEATTTDEIFQNAVDNALAAGLIKNGDLVVITGGMPVGISGTTNMIKIHIVGDILVSGISLNGLSATGVLCVIASSKSSPEDFKGGDILVIEKSSEQILHLIKNASAVITEEGADSPTAIVARALDIPVIVEAAKATEILTSGIAVRIDGEKGLVYSGQSKSGLK